VSLILASASPARAALLRAAGVAHEIEPARVDEEAVKAGLDAAGARPRDAADALAELKALRVSARRPGRLVLGADQTAELAGARLDKPRDREAARAQLRALRGATHALHSAAALALDGAVIWRHVGLARLTMRGFSDAFLEDYLDRMGERATRTVGGYELEGEGVQLFARVEGDHFTVLGLPLIPLLDVLRARGELPS
jgi:septum formation protein